MAIGAYKRGWVYQGAIRAREGGSPFKGLEGACKGEPPDTYGPPVREGAL